MEKFHETYGFYPKYPIADAGDGSFNNYIYCEQHGMEKYMKFLVYKKELTDKQYRQNPYRAVNFRIDENGILRCPDGRAFRFLYRKNVRGNHFGRQEEVYPVRGLYSLLPCIRLQTDRRLQSDRPLVQK